MNEVPQAWIDLANAAAQRTAKALDERSDELTEAVMQGIAEGEEWATSLENPNETDNKAIHPDFNYVMACYESLIDPDWKPNRKIWEDLCEVALNAMTRQIPEESELNKILEALEFYADHDNWYGTYVVDSKSSMYDDWGDPNEEWTDGKPGNKAREALREYYKIKPES